MSRLPSNRAACAGATYQSQIATADCVCPPITQLLGRPAHNPATAPVGRWMAATEQLSSARILQEERRRSGERFGQILVENLTNAPGSTFFPEIRTYRPGRDTSCE